MKELQEILTAWDALRRQGRSAALSTVVAVEGSSYRRPGARMLIPQDGPTVGSVSGGCLEADVVERARTVLQTGEAAVITYDTTEDTDIVFGVGLGCRGVIQILIEPLSPESSEALDLPATTLSVRTPGVLATAYRAGEDIPVGRRFLLRADGTVSGDCPGDHARDVAADALARGRSGRTTVQGTEFFLEYLLPPLPLLVCGAGHDAPPLVRLAKELGWHVTVRDPRPAYATAERFPPADSVGVCRPEEVPVPTDARAAVVLMTHNYLHDRELLRRLLPSPAAYVGVLGPKRRTEHLLADLRDEGLTPTAAQMGRLHSPIGLDIGADTPESIALSIVAEIQAAAAGRAGRSLRERPGPIYPRPERDNATPAGDGEWPRCPASA